MNMNEYQELAERTINKELTNDEKLMHSLFGMVSEIGEIHGIYQKAFQGHDLCENGVKEHAKKELGDLLWFIAEYCSVQGWDMADIAQLNIDKLKKRYPKGFETKRSLKRKKGDI